MSAASFMESLFSNTARACKCLNVFLMAMSSGLLFGSMATFPGNRWLNEDSRTLRMVDRARVVIFLAYKASFWLSDMREAMEFGRLYGLGLGHLFGYMGLLREDMMPHCNGVFEERQQKAERYESQTGTPLHCYRRHESRIGTHCTAIGGCRR